MSTPEDFLKTIGKDEALMRELMQAWEQGAGVQEIAGLLAGKGIEAPMDQVEGLLAQVQNEAAGTIGAQDLDLDELDRVAGGGEGLCDGPADCDDYLKQFPNTPRKYRCHYFRGCDSGFAVGVCKDEVYKE